MTIAQRLTSSLVVMVALLAFAPAARAATYYVSTSGADTNAGSQSAPFKTFSKAISVLAPGDELKVFPGTYTGRVAVNKSGTASAPITISPVSGRPILSGNATTDVLDVTGSHLVIKGLEVTNGRFCVRAQLNTQNITFDNLVVHECDDHGVYIEGKNVIFQNGELYRAVLDNVNSTASSGWGSGMKVKVGAENTTIRNNKIYHNWGEGIGATRGKGVLIEGNTVYNNFGVNIYVDNSPDSTVRNNYSYCTANSPVLKEGETARGIELAEEYYDGWGAQMQRVNVYNNIVDGCRYGFIMFDGGQSGTAIKDIKVINNTIVNITKTGIGFDPLPTQGTNIVANNLVHATSTGKTGYTDINSGITFRNNFWVSGYPTADFMRGTGDVGPQAAGWASTPTIGNINSYKITSSSPAVNKGFVTSVSIPQDFYGATRDSQPDIGAHEPGGSVATPTPTPTPTPVVTPTPTPTPTATPGTCAEDIDMDRDVDFMDYTILVNDFFKTNPSNPRSNIDGQGGVNILDYSRLVNRYGESC